MRAAYRCATFETNSSSVNSISITVKFKDGTQDWIVLSEEGTFCETGLVENACEGLDILRCVTWNGSGYTGECRIGNEEYDSMRTETEKELSFWRNESLYKRLAEPNSIDTVETVEIVSTDLTNGEGGIDEEYFTGYGDSNDYDMFEESDTYTYDYRTETAKREYKVEPADY